MNLFVYGTLLVPRILHAVTGLDNWETAPASLPGYEIFRVKGGDFPGIVKGTGSVPGKVILRVPEPAMDRLDAYEDSFYDRKLVDVTAADDVISAFVYVVPTEVADTVLSDEPWTLEWFGEYALDRYWERLFQ